MPPVTRMIAHRVALVLEDKFMGFVESVKGGTIRGEVATYQASLRDVPTKHLAGLFYEPFIFTAGLDMNYRLYEWISDSMAMRRVVKSGELVICNQEFETIRVQQFQGARLVEVSFPGADASAADWAHLAVTLEPASITYVPGDYSAVAVPTAQPAKRWYSSNFRVEIGNLPTARVRRVAPFTWSHDAVPNIRLDVSVADLSEWMDWFVSFLVEGNHDELFGSVTLLGPDLKEELARIELLNVGLVSLDAGWPLASQDLASWFTVEMYVEGMRFIHSP